MHECSISWLAAHLALIDAYCRPCQCPRAQACRARQCSTAVLPRNAAYPATAHQATAAENLAQSIGRLPNAPRTLAQRQNCLDKAQLTRTVVSVCELDSAAAWSNSCSGDPQQKQRSCCVSSAAALAGYQCLAATGRSQHCQQRSNVSADHSLNRAAGFADPAHAVAASLTLSAGLTRAHGCRAQRALMPRSAPVDAGMHSVLPRSAGRSSRVSRRGSDCRARGVAGGRASGNSAALAMLPHARLLSSEPAGGCSAVSQPAVAGRSLSLQVTPAWHPRPRCSGARRSTSASSAASTPAPC